MISKVNDRIAKLIQRSGACLHSLKLGQARRDVQRVLFKIGDIAKTGRGSITCWLPMMCCIGLHAPAQIMRPSCEPFGADGLSRECRLLWKARELKKGAVFSPVIGLDRALSIGVSVRQLISVTVKNQECWDLHFLGDDCRPDQFTFAIHRNDMGTARPEPVPPSRKDHPSIYISGVFEPLDEDKLGSEKHLAQVRLHHLVKLSHHAVRRCPALTGHRSITISQRIERT